MNQSSDSIIIDNKKISHQLGAKIGTHPSTQVGLTRAKPPRRQKATFKKLEQHLFTDKKDAYSQNANISVSIVEASQINDENSEIDTELIRKSNDKLIEALKSTDTIENINHNLSNKTSKFTCTEKKSIVFSVPLSGIMQSTGQPLPQKILEAMRFIKKKSQVEVGIFRKNGVKTRINKIKELIDKNESINFNSNEYTTFDIADTIKLYFRDLPECLITNKLSDILLSNYDSKFLNLIYLNLQKIPSY